jgi:hypothetical protein
MGIVPAIRALASCSVQLHHRGRPQNGMVVEEDEGCAWTNGTIWHLSENEERPKPTASVYLDFSGNRVDICDD